ncbi:MAG: hypothetical protein H6668_12295 [Ardenticatenaceae bacterium]|nr:hypothetical protein [Ardenticatenaceae bacterium]
MLTLPAFCTHQQTAVYRDTTDKNRFYLDAPAPDNSNTAVRWLSTPTAAAYLVSDIRFGADPQQLQTAGQRLGGYLHPVPWNVSPVFAWGQHNGRVRMIAHGRTAGYGSHNVVLGGELPAAMMGQPIVIAAELTAQAQLTGAGVRGHATAPDLVADLIGQIPTGSRVSWATTLADVLLPTLRELLRRQLLTLLVDASDVTLNALSELRDQALLEWASRLATAARTSLAAPAAAIEQFTPGSIDWTLTWPLHHTIPLRAMRVIRTRGTAVSPSTVQESLLVNQ